MNGLAQDFALTQLRVGPGGDNLRGLAPVFFFELPTLGSRSVLAGAELDLTYLGISQFTVLITPEFGVNLYGLGTRSTPTILSSDYYDGLASGSQDTLLVQGLITPTTAPGTLQISGTTFLDYIESLYNADGTPTAKYAVFRLNADGHLPVGSGPYRGYEFASADNPNSASTPQLNLYATPEPSSAPTLLIGIAALGCVRFRLQRRPQAAGHLKPA